MHIQSHTIRVLLVEDDEDDYIVVRDLLSNLSYMEFILHGFRITGLDWMQYFRGSSMSACWTTGLKSEMGWSSWMRP
jgi:hypothetical protein